MGGATQGSGATGAILAVLVNLFRFLFRGLGSAIQKIGMVISVIVGGLSVYYELDFFLEALENKNIDQRNIRLFTHGLNIALNITYIVAIISTAIFSVLSLYFIAVAIECVTYLRLSYVLYQAKAKLKRAQDSFDQAQKIQSKTPNPTHDTSRMVFRSKIHLEEVQEEYFQKQTETTYSRAFLLTSVIFVLGYFFSPLYFMAWGILITAKIIQLYDNYYDLKVTRTIYKTEKMAEQNNGSYVKMAPTLDLTQRHRHSNASPRSGQQGYFNWKKTNSSPKPDLSLAPRRGNPVSCQRKLASRK